MGVHIADVTHFVKPDTALDTEASDRCTTVYLTDKRIDMVPELLGSNLCSLRSNVDRLAFSVLWYVVLWCMFFHPYVCVCACNCYGADF